jgi:multicomponent Na+:H+ antiporter subunit A
LGFIPTLLKTAKIQTRFFQSGKLRNYLIIIALTLVAFVWYFVYSGENTPAFSSFFKTLVGFKWHEVLVVVMMAVALVLTMVAKSRLTVIVSLGLVGYGTALMFLFFGAPDVAMTQFLIETLTVVLFILILNKLPKFVEMKLSVRLRLLVPAILFGLTMSFVLLCIHQIEFDPILKTFFAENSYLVAKGRNIVNVILVDFRGLDTLGEITVLLIAALGVYSLLKVKQVK